MDDMTEAEAMEANSDGGAADHFAAQEFKQRSNYFSDELARLHRLKADAQRAETGATIRCSQCGKRVVKKSYQAVFCSNAKTHGKKNCKDRWHNRVAGLEKALMNMSDYAYRREVEEL